MGWPRGLKEGVAFTLALPLLRLHPWPPPQLELPSARRPDGSWRRRLCRLSPDLPGAAGRPASPWLFLWPSVLLSRCCGHHQRDAAVRRRRTPSPSPRRRAELPPRVAAAGPCSRPLLPVPPLRLGGLVTARHRRLGPRPPAPLSCAAEPTRLGSPSSPSSNRLLLLYKF